MKVNLIIPSFYPATVYGGPIFSTLHTCKSLSELDDIEVYVSTTNINGNSRLDVEKNNWVKFNDYFFVKYYNETMVGKFSFFFFLNVWKDIKFSDVVHLQGIFSPITPITLIYALIFRKPILMSPRGNFCEWGLAQGSRFKNIWIKLIVNPFVSHVSWHATSEAEKEDILKLYPMSNVYIVPNGVDLNSYSHVNYLTKNMYTDKYIGKELAPSKTIVSMGRLHKVKRFDILIKSFVRILNIHPDAILLIAGKDEGEKANLDTLVEEYNLKNSVYFVGEVSDQNKIDFLGNADLFVLSSESENFGNVYIESLAAGTPIVASTGTPWQEVEGANCGKWVHNSVEETTKAICQMLQKDREQMRLNSRKLSQKYDWKNIATQFEKIFKKMIVNKKKRR